MPRHYEIASTGGFLAFLAFIIGIFAAYGTHIFWGIKLLMNESTIPVGKVVLMLLGAFVPPFGIVHGVFLWFN